MNKIEIDDVVRLNSNVQRMTIENIMEDQTPPQAKCIWIDANGELNEYVFNLRSLILVRKA